GRHLPLADRQGGVDPAARGGRRLDVGLEPRRHPAGRRHLERGGGRLGSGASPRRPGGVQNEPPLVQGPPCPPLTTGTLFRRPWDRMRATRWIVFNRLKIRWLNGNP